LRAPVRLRPLILGALLCLGPGLPGPVDAQADLSRVQLATLPNGLRVLLAPDSLATAVEVGAWFGAGQADENPLLPGITRVLEGLMWRGPGSEERSRRVAAAGGVAGSITTPDLTCFYETLPVSELELGLQIEAARMRSLAVTPSELDAERARIRAERGARGETDPGARGLQRLFAAVFPGHPYRRPPAGTDAGLARITARDCEADFRARFAPNRALVSIVGRFDPAAALALARATLGPLPRRAPPPPRPAPTAAPRVRRSSEPLDSQLRLLFLGWRAPAGGDPDAAPLDVLARVLASGPGSRLVRETAGADSDLLFAKAAYEGRREGGLFYAFGALKPGADSAAVEQALAARIEKLATTPVEDEELERAKRQAESATLFGWQNVHGRGTALGTAQLVEGDFRATWSRLEHIRKLSAADVQRAAARVLKGETRSAVWLVPSRRATQPGAAGGQ